MFSAIWYLFRLMLILMVLSLVAVGTPVLLAGLKHARPQLGSPDASSIPPSDARKLGGI